MKKIYNKIISSRLALLLVLAWFTVSTTSCTYQYYTPSGGTFSGTTTYCQGAAAGANAFSYSECTSGIGLLLSGVTCTAQWYYNTTGSTSIAASTALGGPTTFTSDPGSGGILNYTPLTTTAGTFYYFVNITWTTTGTCTSPFTSGTQTITINGTPAAITGPSVVCPGNTISLSDVALSGTWSSSAASIASVVSSTGVVTGVSPGTANITYTAACGSVTHTVTVDPPPSAITGAAAMCPSSSITLSDVSTPGTWSSGSPTVATVDATTGVVTGLIVGTSVISYQIGTGCHATAIVTVNPPPSAITGTPRMCVGQTAIVGDALSGGTWASNNTSIVTVSPAGVLTGIATGNAIITYTSTCGYVTVEATIDPNPASVVGRDTVCVGSTTAFADITLGGSWSSSTPSVASVLTTSGLITGVSAGTAVITYQMPGGCYSTKSVRVLPPPSAIAGTTQVCPGATTTLTDPVAGGVWGSTNTYVATVGTANGVVTGQHTDTTSIFYSTAFGCTVSKVVTVNALPLPISGNISGCAYLTDTFYDATPGGTWSSSSPSVATIGAATGILTTVSGGTTTISYTQTGSGCAATKMIRVYPTPVIAVTYNYYTNTFYADSTWVTYQWYNSVEGLIPGATSYHTAAIFDGYYYVVVTDTNGCALKSANINYNSSMLGTPSQAQIPIKIYPNPTKEMIYIEAPVAVRAEIRSVDGKKEIDKANAKEIDISRLADGVYFITLFDAKGQMLTVQKLLKQ